MAAVTVTLDAFSGPLDLLCHLIKKNELNIHDIPIAIITDQYLEYIAACADEKMDVASEFIVMAATLIEVKSRTLLPKPEPEALEDEEDLKEKLTRMLVEYERFKELSLALGAKAGADNTLYFRKPQPPESDKLTKPDPASYMTDVTIAGLREIFNNVIARRELRTDKIHGGFNSVTIERYTVEEKMTLIKKMLKANERISFMSILGDRSTKNEKLSAFLALLELNRLNQVTIEQDGLFGDITIVNS